MACTRTSKEIATSPDAQTGYVQVFVSSVQLQGNSLMAGSRTEIAELAYCTPRSQTAFLYQTEHTPIPLLFLSHSLKGIQKLNIDAFVAGSDQICRYGYVPDKRLFFYSFASPEICKRSIAYAACLGVDTWEWPQALTDICRPLAQEFKALSVREESGIPLRS